MAKTAKRFQMAVPPFPKTRRQVLKRRSVLHGRGWENIDAFPVIFYLQGSSTLKNNKGEEETKREEALCLFAVHVVSDRFDRRRWMLHQSCLRWNNVCYI